MARYRIVTSDEAEADLLALRVWLFSVAPAQTAQRFLRDLLDHLAEFAEAPHRGTIRSPRAGGIRVVGWRRTITFVFTVNDALKTVVFIGVLYRGRDVESVISQRLPDDPPE